SWAGFERAGIATAGVSGGSVTTGPVRLPGRSQDEAGLEASVFLVPDLGSSSFDSAMSATVVAWPTGEPVRVVATPEVLRQLGRRPGDDVALVVDRTAVPATVVAATPFVPGTDGHRDAVLVDADAFSRRLIEYGLDGPTANRWWLDVDDAGAARLADALAPLGGTTVGAAATARQAQRAPLAVGWQGARWLVVLAAGILACVGFALHTAVAIRLRRIEFAQLLSLGVRRRQLERVVATEGLLLWALGTACGLAVGLLLTRTLPSLVAMSAPFGRPVPPVAVHLAWWPTLVLVGVVAGMLGLVLAVVTRSLRASVLGAVLRLGDER
ncbi:MAG: ABC transporter permease, partial [Kineosporiaceae bacterium]